jgi:hypothetical protein
LTVGNASYSGTFDEGQFVAGDYTSPEGIVYSAAQFVSFNLIDGKGTIKYPDGSVFVGNFKVRVFFGGGFFFFFVLIHRLPCKLGIKEGEGRHEYANQKKVISPQLIVVLGIQTEAFFKACGATISQMELWNGLEELDSG